MDSVEYTGDPALLRCLPGRVLLEIEPLPDKIGSIAVPETARTQKVTDISLTAKVLKVGYGGFSERVEKNGKRVFKTFPGVHHDDFKVGDRVRFRALMADLNRKMIVTSVHRLDAVLEG
jgi:hypothetical protein